MKYLKTTGHGTARSLMIDDHFKLGGVMYRIKEVETNILDLTIIIAYPVKKHTNRIIEITVPGSTRFKFYNQKQ